MRKINHYKASLYHRSDRGPRTEMQQFFVYRSRI